MLPNFGDNYKPTEIKTVAYVFPTYTDAFSFASKMTRDGIAENVLTVRRVVVLVNASLDRFTTARIHHTAVSRNGKPFVDALAAEFRAVMREYAAKLGFTLETVDALNAAESDPQICHSHDFCDANQALLDALERLELDYDSAIDDDHLCPITDYTWTQVKREGFAR